MVKKVMAIGACSGVGEILSTKGYVVEHVDQKNVLDVLKKEGVEAVIIDMDDTARANVIISGIRHLYPGLWITAISGNNDNKQQSLALKSGASNYIVKPIDEKNLSLGMEESQTSENPSPPLAGDVEWQTVFSTEAKKRTVPADILDESKKIFPSRFYNAFFVTEYGKLEALRTERYNKNFSVILTHIEGFNNLKKKLGKDEILAFLKELIKTMMETLRNCDVMGMVEDKKIVAILPETDYFGSCIAVRKIKKAIENVTTKGEPYASIIFSNVSYPRDGNGYGELLAAADKRIQEQREGLWLKLGFENKPFWEIISILLSGKGFEEKDITSFDIGKGLALPSFFLDRLQEMIFQEILRDPNKKGILYLGAMKISPNLPILKAVDTIGVAATKIFIVGEGEEKRWNLPNATPIYLSDSRLLETFFIFFLGEDFSYAVVCKERWGDQYSCFHTSVPYLTEGLINKFQKEYSLQEQL
ncbi:MAG: response regulator [Deltaproteobacteria bacterium]|nr:response regulator [Deltaproteobacteria bacterium]